MLELNNVTKVYAAKGGASVRALDGVSVRFGEKGLVFLLGKSGSGKSTLLNVAGGLDRPTEGEIIVGDKRSSDFTPSDFDSYRNTYVGFVFQEYNLLDEFSVRENISLALELQGKAQARQDVDRILEEVDLSGYGSRRPNTLSGGQKQRVAIARALVKDPRIIMADEPTGALDSETGRQVFEMLKKLSRERLVIVVSHDREFAECYGDRIIELADGKIISDVTRSAGADAEKPLHLRAGDALTGEQLARLQDLLTEGGELNIAEEQKGLSLSRKNAVKGTRGTFEKTGKIPPAAAQEKTMIRSRMPLKKAVKMGVKSMKTKPFRLAFTIFLSTIAFTVFGLMSSFMLYSPVQAGINAVKEQDYQAIILKKQYEYYPSGENSPSYSETPSTEAEVSALSAAFGRSVYGVVTFYDELNTEVDMAGRYAALKGLVPMSEEEFKENGFSVLYGTYPQNLGEVAITAYQFELIRAGGWKQLGEDGWVIRDEFGNEVIDAVDRYEDIIGKRQTVLDRKHWVTITAVVDCGEIPERIRAYGRSSESEEKSYFSDWMNNSFHGCFFTSENFISEYTSGNGPLYLENLESASVQSNLEGDYGRLHSFSELGAYFNIIWDGEKQTSLKEDEIVIEKDYFDRLSSVLFLAISNVSNMQWADLRESEDFQRFQKICGFSEPQDGTPAAEDLKFALHFLNENYQAVTGGKICSLQAASDSSVRADFRIVGLIDRQFSVYHENLFLTADSVFALFYQAEDHKIETSYRHSADDCYDTLLMPLEGPDDAILEDVFALFDVVGENDARYTADSMVKSNADYLSNVMKTIANVFLYGGLVFALFSALLLFNFISATVSCKRREIGVLRAVGARRADVFFIFFAESFVVMLICVLLSCIGGAVLTTVMNGYLLAGISIEISFRAITFGIVNILMILGISLVVAFLGTFLPVYRAAMKNPVESIRSI